MPSRIARGRWSATLLAGAVLALANGLASADEKQPNLALSTSGDSLEVAKVNALRPMAAEQPLYLFVRNPTRDPIKARVQVRASKDGPVLAESVVLGVPKERDVVVQFPPSAAGAPPTWSTLAGPDYTLHLTLHEINAAGAPKEPPLQQLAQPLFLQKPTYVEATGATFNADTGALQIRVKVKPDFTGPPAVVQLSGDRIPGFERFNSATTRVTLSKANPEGILEAEGIDRAKGAADRGQVTVSVDGYERAFIYALDFLGGQQTLQPVRDTSVRLKGYIAQQKPVDALPLTVEVDNPPPTEVKVKLQLGRERDGRFQAERTEERPKSRDEQVQMRVAGKELLFKAALADWKVPFDTAGVTGKRLLHAELLGRDSQAVVKEDWSLVFDDSAPAGARITAVAGKAPTGDDPVVVPAGRQVRVAAAATDAESGIAKVRVFWGKPVDGKDGKEAPQDAVVGTASPDGKSWTATLPAAAKNGSAEVGVEFVNKVGMRSFGRAEVDVRAPAATTAADEPMKGTPKKGEDKKNGAAKTDEKPKKGTLKVTVVQDGREQKAVPVVLKNEKGEEVDTKDAADNADGEYIFKDLEPGKYKASATKTVSTGARLRGEADAKVEAGKTAKAEVELKRR